MLLNILLLASVTIITPNTSNAPTARPICLINLGPTLIVNRNDVVSVNQDGNKVRVQLLNGTVHYVQVPTDIEPQRYALELSKRVQAACAE
jgi:hypothetical protein